MVAEQASLRSVHFAAKGQATSQGFLAPNRQFLKSRGRVVQKTLAQVRICKGLHTSSEGIRGKSRVQDVRQHERNR